MPAMLQPWIVEQEIRDLFGNPRPVDVSERGKWPVFERAHIVAVDLLARTATFQRHDRLDWRTHPTGAHTTITTRTFALDDLRWVDHKSLRH